MVCGLTWGFHPQASQIVAARAQVGRVTPVPLALPMGSLACLNCWVGSAVTLPPSFPITCFRTSRFVFREMTGKAHLRAAKLPRGLRGWNWYGARAYPHAGEPRIHTSRASCCSEIPHSLPWDLKVLSYHGWPRGVTKEVSMMESLRTGRGRLIHSCSVFPTKLASAGSCKGEGSQAHNTT